LLDVQFFYEVIGVINIINCNIFGHSFTLDTRFHKKHSEINLIFICGDIEIELM